MFPCPLSQRTGGGAAAGKCGKIPAGSCVNSVDNGRRLLYNLWAECIEVWLSLVERCVRDAEVVSSNLATSTIRQRPVRRYPADASALLQAGSVAYIIFRGMAQFGRALRSGRRGREFESRYLDHGCNPAERKPITRFPFSFASWRPLFHRPGNIFCLLAARFGRAKYNRPSPAV